VVKHALAEVGYAAPTMVDLGAELSRHRLRPGAFAGLAAAVAVGAACLAAVHPLAALLALVPLGFLLFLLVTRGGDRLTVHRDGFALRHRGAVRSFAWADVEPHDVRLGSDRRPRLRSFTTRDGERIAFAPLMGGLDVLHHAYLTEGGRTPPPEPARSTAGIGVLRSTHGAPASGGYGPAMFVAGTLLLFALALLYFTLDTPHPDAHDVAAGAGCTAAALGFGALLLWLALADRHDELRLHEHGFAYRHRGTVQECRWDEIANYRRNRRGITGVMRDDGTWINLSPELPAVREHVTPRVRVKPDNSPPAAGRGRRRRLR
jgi:hypothetical protein